MSEGQRWLRPWWIWIMPLICLGFAGYLLYSYVDWDDYRVTIAFDEVDGIEPGKTRIKYRGVNVGRVTSVHLSTQTVILVEAHLNKDMRPVLKSGGTFWLIEANIGLGEIQGMGTLFAGPYLDVQPGRRMRDEHFIGMSRPPRGGERFEGLTFKLHTPFNQSLGIGNPLLYRGVRVGAVTGLRLTSDSRQVEVDVKVAREYDHLVRSNSVFWEESGIRADIGLLGAKINIPTLDALLAGGISFATPDPPGAAVTYGQAFVLHPSAKKEWQTWAPAIKS